MKLYSEPELEIVKFETPNTMLEVLSEGTGPDVEFGS